MELDKRDSKFDLDEDRVEVYSKYVLFYNHAYKGNKVQAVSNLVSIRLGFVTQIKNIDEQLFKAYKITDSLQYLSTGDFNIELKFVQQGKGKTLKDEVINKAEYLFNFIEDLKFSYGYGITTDDQLINQLKHTYKIIASIISVIGDNWLVDNWKERLKANLQLYRQHYLAMYHINCITTIIGEILLKNYPIQISGYAELNNTDRVNLLSINPYNYHGKLTEECVQELIKYRSIYSELSLDDFFKRVWKEDSIFQQAQTALKSGKVETIEISWRKLRNLSFLQCPNEFSLTMH